MIGKHHAEAIFKTEMLGVQVADGSLTFDMAVNMLMTQFPGSVRAAFETELRLWLDAPNTLGGGAVLDSAIDAILVR